LQRRAHLWRLADDDDADGFALVKSRLRIRLFKVQGVQEFKDGDEKNSDNLERLTT
jgi:hypothetical protein